MKIKTKVRAGEESGVITGSSRVAGGRTGTRIDRS